MNCPICFEDYGIINRKPKNLSCGHVICQECVFKIKGSDKQECPTCRTNLSMNLPICYPIYDILVKESKKSKRLFCSDHTLDSCVFFCLQCEVDICHLCLVGKHKKHVMLTLEDKDKLAETRKRLTKWEEYFKHQMKELNQRLSCLRGLKGSSEQNEVECIQNFDFKMIESSFKSFRLSSNAVLSDRKTSVLDQLTEYKAEILEIVRALERSFKEETIFEVTKKLNYYKTCLRNKVKP